MGRHSLLCDCSPGRMCAGCRLGEKYGDMARKVRERLEETDPFVLKLSAEAIADLLERAK
jgi:hypothetical protein